MDPAHSEPRRPTESEIDEAERDSFPASDPHALGVERRPMDGPTAAPASGIPSGRRASSTFSRRRRGALGTWLLTLALGVATTVGIAWLLAMWTPALPPGVGVIRFASPGITVDGSPIVVARDDALGTMALSANLSSPLWMYGPDQILPLESVAPKWSHPALLSVARDATGTSWARAVFATGWPFPCMYASYIAGTGGGFRALDGVKVLDAPPPPYFVAPLSMRERALPLRIAWTPFVGNVLIWTALWAFLLFLPPSLRRSWRRRHARCVACGHERRGLGEMSPCPECGAAVPARRPEHRADLT